MQDLARDGHNSWLGKIVILEPGQATRAVLSVKTHPEKSME